MTRTGDLKNGFEKDTHMQTRRNFIRAAAAALASLPFVGKAVAKPRYEDVRQFSSGYVKSLNGIAPPDDGSTFKLVFKQPEILRVLGVNWGHRNTKWDHTPDDLRGLPEAVIDFRCENEVKYNQERARLRAEYPIGGGPVTQLAVIVMCADGVVECHKTHEVRIDDPLHATSVVQFAINNHCTYIAHDKGGAGIIHETIMLQAGWPLDRTLPMWDRKTLKSNRLIEYKPGYEPHDRDYFAVDKERSKLFLSGAVKAEMLVGVSEADRDNDAIRFGVVAAWHIMQKFPDLGAISAAVTPERVCIEADWIAQLVVALPQPERVKFMAELKASNEVLHALVKGRLAAMRGDVA